jgi:hypothetical protein
MAADPRALVGRITKRFKQRFWGRTFRCPVCHLELSLHDLDANGLVVCPLCGVVLELDLPYGHAVPVVHDVEIFRPQPKLRVHPMATHIPIGLYPFAVLGAFLLAMISAAGAVGIDLGAAVASSTPLIEQATLVLLALSVGFSLITAASGLWDWAFRYRRRRYAQITLKIACAVAFLALGAVAVALHVSGIVFSQVTGLMDLATFGGLLAGLIYLAALTVGMVLLATLGHVGGNLVFGR